MATATIRTKGEPRRIEHVKPFAVRIAGYESTVHREAVEGGGYRAWVELADGTTTEPVELEQAPTAAELTSLAVAEVTRRREQAEPRRAARLRHRAAELRERADRLEQDAAELAEADQARAAALRAEAERLAG